MNELAMGVGALATLAIAVVWAALGARREADRTIAWMHATKYPDRYGRPVRRDPTHGRIDRDIQWWVQTAYRPRDLSTRVALENNIQDKREKGLL